MNVRIIITHHIYMRAMSNFVRGTVQRPAKRQWISGFYIQVYGSAPKIIHFYILKSSLTICSFEMITNGSPYWKLIIVTIIITEFSRNINFSWSKCNPSISISHNKKVTFSLSLFPSCDDHIFMLHCYFTIFIFVVENCLKVVGGIRYICDYSFLFLWRYLWLSNSIVFLLAWRW